MALRSLLSVALVGLLLTACNKQAETPTPAAAVTPGAAAPVPAMQPPVILSGTRADYTIAQTADGYTLTNKSGKEPAINIEARQRLRFSDISISFDKKGNPGAAYRLYYTAFNRTPDHAGLGYWLKALDSGMSLDAVASLMANSEEFAGLYAADLSADELIRRFHKNVLRRTGDESEIASWREKMERNNITRAALLAGISSGEAALKSDQLGIDNGILYTEEGVKYAPFASDKADSVLPATAPAK